MRTNCLIVLSLLCGNLTAIAQTTYASWRTANSISAADGPASDADKDGVPLLVEYALNMSPSQASTQGLPTHSYDSATGKLSLSYPRLRDDLFYEVQASDQLNTWSVMGVESTDVPVGQTAQASISSSDTKRFLRLRVILTNSNASTAGSLTAPFPTLENISLDWAQTGDGNRNGIVSTRFRKMGDTTWRNGMPLRRVPAATNTNVSFSWTDRHSGSLFDLAPDTNYEVEVALDDPDGGSTARRLMVKTRPVPTLPPNPRLRNATPANAQSLLDNALPGDIIQLGSGAYSNLNFSKDGTEGNPIVLRGAPGAVVTGPIGIFLRNHIMLTELTVTGRIRFNGSNNFTITRCQVTASTTDGFGDCIVCQVRGTNSYIADNIVTGTTTWNEAALGNQGGNLGEGILVMGPGHVITNNRVKGFRDGISFTETTTNNDQISIDVLNNEISECADDGIEADFAQANCRIMRNRITNSFIALSSQPSLGGPTYFIRNVAYNVVNVPFKLYRISDGDVIIHNTVVKNGDAFAIYSGPDAIHRNTFSRNNLFLGGPGGTYNGFSSGSGRLLDLSYLDTASADLNYNSYGSTVTGFAAKVGSTLYNSLATLRAGTTEKNTITVGYSVFSNSIAFPSVGSGTALSLYTPVDLRPAATAPLVGAAQPLSNMNDHTSSPTIGAYEPGQALPIYGPRP